MNALLITLVLTTQAEIVVVPKPVECTEVTKLLPAIVASDYKETPVWFGSEPDTGSNYTLFANPTTKTWTLIQFDHKVACILGAGITSTTK
jgi:hypothetical protein